MSINQGTKLRIGSLTKTFTVALVIKAIEEGKLKLDNKLDVYYQKVYKKIQESEPCKKSYSGRPEDPPKPAIGSWKKLAAYQ